MIPQLAAASMDSQPSLHVPRGARRDGDPIAAVSYVRGDGAYLWDDTGKRYLDFLSGYSSTLFGHAHPQLVGCARDQMATLAQVVGLPHPWRGELEMRLAHLAPLAEPAKVWLSSSGARAVEVAWKVAFAFRPGRILAFDRAYHGRSLATAQISNTRRLPILEPPVDRSLPFPDCQGCPVGLQPSSCQAECFDRSEQKIESRAKEISAIIVEPAIGARGYYFAPPVFFQRLSALARRTGIVLIDDEIQMGLGRLGSLFAAQSQGWQPDLIVLGKSLGGGLVPISAVVGRAEILDALDPGIESETFAANPLACRLAIESLELLTHGGLIEQAVRIGAWLRQGLAELENRWPQRVRTASQGAAGVIEIVPHSGSSKTFEGTSNESAEIAKCWVTRAHQAGLLLHWTGAQRNRIAIIPPLIATESQIREAFAILHSIG